MDRNVTTALDVNLYDENADAIYGQYFRFPERLLYDQPDTRDTLKWFWDDYHRIARYYHRYLCGVSYKPEGYTEKRKVQRADGTAEIKSTIAYKPTRARFKKIAQLINKQSRFLFGVNPDIRLNIDMDTDKELDTPVKEALGVTQEMLDNILIENDFYAKLLQASKDCAIGKRVACIVNFNLETGITVDFVSAFHFTYLTDQEKPSKLTMFSYIAPLKIGSEPCDELYIKKVYTMAKRADKENEEYCYIREIIYDHGGKDITAEYEQETGVRRYDGFTELQFIPAQVIVNMGLIDQKHGISDVEDLESYESLYNFLSGLDIDALKKNMNPMKYTVDMDRTTTGGMSNALGAYADLQSDRKDPDSKSPQIGLLESNMNYVNPLNDIIKKITKNMHDSVDVPDVDLETMSGVITSGKALKAIYWGLITRCDEKMKVWEPAIRHIVEIIIDGAHVYMDSATSYLSGETFPVMINYEVVVERNNPLPEDEEEEKNINMAEVQNQLMSRKSYMIKWYGMTDSQANKELIQIAIENSIINDQALPLEELDQNSLLKQLKEEYGLNLGDINEDTTTEEETVNFTSDGIQVEDEITEES